MAEMSGKREWAGMDGESWVDGGEKRDFVGVGGPILENLKWHKRREFLYLANVFRRRWQ